MIHKITALIQYWLAGIRIYIAFAAVILTLAVWWWGHTLFGGTQLEIIRIQEVYGWLSIGFLALALMIGPLLRLAPQLPGKAIIWDSRRAMGLSAAWFGLLHTLIVYFKQFDATNPTQLPSAYQQAMLIGLIGLIILLIMAATSVNAIMRSWGIWWFRVHRLVYAAVILVLIHAFMIGAHAVSKTALIALGILAFGYICLNLASLLRAREIRIQQVISIALCILILTGTLTYGLNQHYEKAREAAELQGHGH